MTQFDRALDLARRPFRTLDALDSLTHHQVDANARSQKDITKIGYTDHLGGMYADKFIHKNIQCEAGRYITIGDKYVDKAVVLPARWKEKQFHVPQV